MIRLCNSVTVLVGLEVFSLDSTATEEGESLGEGEGDATGVGDCEAVGVGMAAVRRSRCALALKLASGIVATISSVSNSLANFACLITNDSSRSQVSGILPKIRVSVS